MLVFLWHWVQRIFTAISFVVLAIVFLPLLCLLVCLPVSIRYDNRLFWFFAYAWNWAIVRSGFLKIRIEGAENLSVYPNNPAIILMNHASSYDIYLMEFLLKGYPHIWISKVEYFKIPLFGFILKRMGVAINRQNPFQSAKSLVKAMELVAEKSRHLVLFPEGTRYSDGKIHEFFKGFVPVAQKLDRPVIPIYVEGLQRYFPRGAYFINPSFRAINIIIGKPMIYQKDESVDAFFAKIHAWFCKKVQSD